MKKKIISGEIISPLSREVQTKRGQEIAHKITNLSVEGSKNIINERTRIDADYLSRYYGSMEHIISMDKKQTSSQEAILGLNEEIKRLEREVKEMREMI